MFVYRTIFPRSVWEHVMRGWNVVGLSFNHQDRCILAPHRTLVVPFREQHVVKWHVPKDGIEARGAADTFSLVFDPVVLLERGPVLVSMTHWSKLDLWVCGRADLLPSKCLTFALIVVIVPSRGGVTPNGDAFIGGPAIDWGYRDMNEEIHESFLTLENAAETKRSHGCVCSIKPQFFNFLSSSRAFLLTSLSIWLRLRVVLSTKQSLIFAPRSPSVSTSGGGIES
ncbi:hypothetical protein CYLTODRAFT_62684 [Cylindrobasidium torrendii FP15055 ss-10]|uniref:Uncharacterized protein n=1 Tax=Cylindrobasidium torrendii FP15055 ss-10 TaxID=1314674 RepID=A0A0D7BPL0_9AGAR|nr:hypothetical protein CYLTODRAFT_62684 [Cylindrobasidium torrendii FP15055 ss-10]